MIPLHLRLQDFMSYASLDLDLTGVHSAVLSGPNGAGKSTLLDAMTYALWDRARAGAEELIRLGQPEMWVELQFEMDGQVYKVVRRRTRKKGAQTQVTFAQMGPDGEFVSLEGTGVRETQARINAVLRMGYETFVNSAFILQGRADQFTTKTPRDRKALLAEILGLQHYDDLAAKARDRWKGAQAKADALEAEQAEVREVLAARQDTQDRLGAAREAATSVEGLLAQARDRQQRLLAEEAGLKAAQDEIATAQEARKAAEAEQARLAEEAAAHAKQMAATRAQLASRAEVEAAYARFEALTAEDQAHRARQDALHAVERRQAATRQEAQAARHAVALERQGLEAELATLLRERQQHQDVLADRARIEQARAQLVQAREAEAAHLDQAGRFRQLDERRAALERQLELARLRQEDERREREARLARALTAAAELPAVQAATDELVQELKRYEIAAVEQDRVKEKGFGYKAAKERAEAAIEADRGRIRAVEAKLAQLAVELEIHAGGRKHLVIERSHACPLCRTELDEERLAGIRQAYEQEIADLEAGITRHEHEAAEAERLRQETRSRYAALLRELERREPAQQRLGELRQRLTDLKAAQAEADALAQELAAAAAPALPEPLVKEREDVTRALAELAYDPAAQAVLASRVADLKWAEARGWQLEQALAATSKIEARQPDLEARLAELGQREQALSAEWEAKLAALDEEARLVGHDAAGMAEVQAELAGLAGARERHLELQKQLLWLEGAGALEARLEAEAAHQARRVAEIALQLATLERRLDRLPYWQQEHAAATVELERLATQARKLHEDVGKLEAEIARLDALEAKLADKQAAWKAALEEVRTFKELSEAFGKNGIQALIIENALPELEEEANRLLSRITDNRMHVRLATQKEKKTGGVGETLEIYISDEVGTRNYEMYSGGEAFRVNFALRLALSRLLARRAGARLQTLVIDEGFGTQDEKGRERLVEAINAVSNEFKRILVITHVRELKDAFNTTIEVSKRGGVSEVKLSA
jgi:exonuclease SbcC